MTALSAQLRKKIETTGLGIALAAKKVGISFQTLRSALLGQRVPNARCVGKFAKFLGISAAAVLKAAGPKGSRRVIGAKTASGARRGRPPGRAAAIGRPSKANAAIIKRISKLIAKATAALTMVAHVPGATASPRVARTVTQAKPRMIRRATRKSKRTKKAQAASAVAPAPAPATVAAVRRRAVSKKKAKVKPVVKAPAAQKGKVIAPKPKRAKSASKSKVVPPAPPAVAQSEAAEQPVQSAT